MSLLVHDASFAGGEPVRLSETYGIQGGQWRISASSEDPVYAVEVEAVYRDGRFVVAHLCVNSDDGVNYDVMRAVPVAKIVRAAAYLIGLSRMSYDAKRGVTSVEPMVETLGEHLAANPPDPETDDGLDLVVALYRLGAALSIAPTTHVAELFDVSRATAGRWVRAARDRGLLAEAPRAGTGGEV